MAADADGGVRQRPLRVLSRWLLVVFVVAVVASALALAAVRSTPAAVPPPSSTSSSSSPASAAVEAMSFDRHFATKTAYWDQRRSGLAAAHTRALRLVIQREKRGLRLVQTQLVTRHGIRYPTLTPIRDVEALLDKLAPLESQLPSWLRGYSLPYNQSVEGQLAHAGVEEMRDFAARQLASHDATRAVYSPATFQLSHTHVTRTKDSAVAFARGYFTNPQEIRYVVRPKNQDRVLRFYDVCERYQREVKRNASALREFHVHASSAAVNASLAALRAALQLSPEAAAAITTTDLAAAFSACAFDLALAGTRHQWCSLFSRAMVDALEYGDDLKEFYLIGGGHAINYAMAAALLQDVVAAMDRRMNGSSALEGVFRFAHAETTLPLLTLLGYGDRTPLRTDATDERVRARGFRSAALAPFAANVAFRLYAKGGDAGSATAARYYVQILVNERDDVEVPGCGAVLCPLETLKAELWRRHLTEFDFDQLCGMPRS